MVSRGCKVCQASSSAAAACKWPAPAVTVAIKTRIERVNEQCVFQTSEKSAPVANRGCLWQFQSAQQAGVGRGHGNVQGARGSSSVGGQGRPVRQGRRGLDDVALVWLAEQAGDELSAGQLRRLEHGGLRRAEIESKGVSFIVSDPL